MLSKKTKYALHTLAFLGKHREERTILIHYIVEGHGIWISLRCHLNFQLSAINL